MERASFLALWMMRNDEREVRKWRERDREEREGWGGVGKEVGEEEHKREGWVGKSGG